MRVPHIAHTLWLFYIHVGPQFYVTGMTFFSPYECTIILPLYEVSAYQSQHFQNSYCPIIS